MVTSILQTLYAADSLVSLVAQTLTSPSLLQNVASDILPGKVLTSKSGTLAYLAPEVYAGRGYDRRADWWSLGVLFYECIYNKVRTPKLPSRLRSTAVATRRGFALRARTVVAV